MTLIDIAGAGQFRTTWANVDVALAVEGEVGSAKGTIGAQTHFTLPARGARTLMIRCTNTSNETQPDFRIWNPAGYMSNSIETTHVVAA